MKSTFSNIGINSYLIYGVVLIFSPIIVFMLGWADVAPFVLLYSLFFVLFFISSVFTFSFYKNKNQLRGTKFKKASTGIILVMSLLFTGLHALTVITTYLEQ